MTPEKTLKKKDVQLNEEQQKLYDSLIHLFNVWAKESKLICETAINTLDKLIDSLLNERRTY